MSTKPSGDLRSRAARGVAVLCSLALGGFVIVNAQFGCDSQDAATPAADSKAPANASPPAAEATPASAKQAEDAPTPAAPATPEPTPTPTPEPTPEPTPTPAEPAERVYMPASKSAGDFDSLPTINPIRDQNQQENQAQQAQQQAPQP